MHRDLLTNWIPSLVVDVQCKAKCMVTTIPVTHNLSDYAGKLIENGGPAIDNVRLTVGFGDIRAGLAWPGLDYAR